MLRIRPKHFLAGLILTLTFAAPGLAQSAGSRTPDAGESTPSRPQADTLSDIELLARAEERVESLRAKLFNIQMQEIDLQAYIEELDFRMTPESIQRALVFVASPRPMDEFRTGLREKLESEKGRANKRLELLVASRERVEAALSRAEAQIERLRQKLALP